MSKAATKMLKRVHSLEFRTFMTVPIVCECEWKLELKPQRNEICLIKKVASEMVLSQTDSGGLKRLQDITFTNDCYPLMLNVLV